MEIPKKNHILSAYSNDKKQSHQSKHFLLELYRCDYEKLNDESFLRCTLNKAAKLAKSTVLNLISNKLNLRELQQLHYLLNRIFLYIPGLNRIILPLIFLHVVKICPQNLLVNI